MPKVEGQAMAEQVALLVLCLRARETASGVKIKTIGPEGGVTENRSTAALAKPLARMPGAGASGVVVDGSYGTLGGLEQFLAAGRSSGAALVALTVRERRFQAGFRVYGRL